MFCLVVCLFLPPLVFVFFSSFVAFVFRLMCFFFVLGSSQPTPRRRRNGPPLCREAGEGGS